MMKKDQERFPQRREELLNLLGVDPNWRMHQVIEMRDNSRHYQPHIYICAQGGSVCLFCVVQELHVVRCLLFLFFLLILLLSLFCVRFYRVFVPLVAYSAFLSRIMYVVLLLLLLVCWPRLVETKRNETAGFGRAEEEGAAPARPGQAFQDPPPR